jgi:pyruvate kinase
VSGTEIRCAVVVGGFLKDRKGMNLPGVRVSAPSLTEKDREDARFALGLGVDFLALSFVRSAADVEGLRAIVTELAPETHIIAKIEKPEALDDIDGILRAADGIMVARGDLGVELPAEVVPIVQAQLVDRARAAGRPVIVATQMLESMVERPRPTRAEVTDVSSAVRSGVDAVMLSAESAAGAYPVASVAAMDRIVRETEGYMWGQAGFGNLGMPFAAPGGPGVAGLGVGPGTGAGSGAFEAAPPPGDRELREAISRATAGLSRQLMVRAIVVFTRSGWSAGMVSASRPQAPILAVTPDPATYRRVNLLWGVVPVLLERGVSGTEELHREARRLARDGELAEPGEYILRVWGFNLDPELNAPTIAVLTV